MKTARLPHAAKAAAFAAPFRRQSPKPRPYLGNGSDAPPRITANAPAGSYECKRRQLVCAERELRGCLDNVGKLRGQVAALQVSHLTLYPPFCMNVLGTAIPAIIATLLFFLLRWTGNESRLGSGILFVGAVLATLWLIVRGLRADKKTLNDRRAARK